MTDDLRHPAQPVLPASSSDVALRHPDMRERKQITVKVTEQFAKDLNLIFASYGMTDVSYVVREAVSAQADYIRARMTARQAVGREVLHEPGKAVLCRACEDDGHTVCM